MSAIGQILPATEEDITRAAEKLAAGGLVAFPTETVYGLGADARNDEAVACIFAAKGRPSFNPLIVHLANAAAARNYVNFDARADALAAQFWPGPLTFVLPRRPDCALSLLVSAGLDTVAVRVPAHPLAHDLLARFGGPIAAPSANASGEVSPTRAEHVSASLGARVNLILNGGPCAVGLESTVVDLSGPAPALLRHGAVTLEQLRDALGEVEDATSPAEGQAPRSPGQLARHYAPRLPLRLNTIDISDDEALIAFGVNAPSGARKTANLSPSGDLVEAAANLFATLRELDDPAFRGIAVVPIPEEGLGLAINDRLRRAAAGSGTGSSENQ